MRIRNLLIMLILLFTLFHFSPQLADAESSEVNGEEALNQEQVKEEVPYIESEIEKKTTSNKGVDSTSEDEKIDEPSTTATEDSAEPENELAEDETIELENEPAKIENEVIEKEKVAGAENETSETEETDAGENKGTEEEQVESDNQAEQESVGADNETALDNHEKACNEESEDTKAVEPEKETEDIVCNESTEDKSVDSENEANEEQTEDENNVVEEELVKTEGETAVEPNGETCNGVVEDPEVAESQNESNKEQELAENETESVEEKEDVCSESTEEEIGDSENKAAEDEEQADEEAKDEDTTEEKAKRITFSTFSVQRTSTFQEGDRHDNIVDLKKKLNSIGFGGITVTNYYGNWTETRVSQFQEYYDLPVNGKLDTKTVNKLNQVYNSPFQEGKRHEDIPEFKKKLNKIGYDGISLTTYFGNWTNTRLRQFQEDHGLHVNGIGDSVTLTLLNVMANKDSFQQGDRHHYLIDLKKQLNRVGFGGITVTNYYGNWTKTRVKQFQDYYGLSNNGKLNKATINKLNEVYNSPFQKGKRHNDTLDLKKDLNKIGYGHISVTTLFGSFTDKQVRAFQKDHGLRVNGIADEVTLAKIDEMVNKTTFKKGDRHHNIVSLKKKLNRVGFGGISETSYYGNWTKTRVTQFQDYYGLSKNGQLDRATVKKLDEVYNSPFQKGKRHKNTVELKKKLNKLGYDGISVTTYFGNWTKTRLTQFQQDHGLRANGIADDVTLKELDKAIKNQNNVKIFLDPGHGGKDPGASGYGLKEKDVVLDIALTTANVLTNNYAGVEVMLSRTTDKFLELSERSQMANSWGADYFISFHNNSFNGSANGFESFIYNGGVSKETKDRQKDMHNYIANKINSNDRGTKTANFHVVRETTMPAILIEYLFIDNYAENALLKQKSYRQKLGRITAEAVSKSFGLKRI